ncbi:MAG TPA: hypothetical protein VFU05_12600 [Cyclobacteriaceae bacterium]|nr:hypothetical protein [Cyclobacteriaceae bacterium]
MSLSSISPLSAQEKEGGNTIPLDHFYVKRQKSGLRALLSKLHFGLSTGYASTNFKHDLDGFIILQQPDTTPKIISSGPPPGSVGYANWFNKVEYTNNIATASSFQVNSDTAEIGFKSKSFNIPLRATVHVEFLNRYRIGGGFSYEFQKVNDFEPTSYGNDIDNFSPSFSSFFMTKYFLILGGSVYRYKKFLLTVDANIGGYGLGKKFEKSQITKGMFVNLGAMVEYEMSEYFRLFVRPSYDIKSYKLNIPETGQSIQHKFNALYFNVGASYRIPELRRCFHKQCKAQVNHAHGNKEYRSRVHPFYKKQNPHHGENYPELIKYKGRNKRKLNPY